jgi:hypothetical protein
MTGIWAIGAEPVAAPPLSGGAAAALQGTGLLSAQGAGTLTTRAVLVGVGLALFTGVGALTGGTGAAALAGTGLAQASGVGAITVRAVLAGTGLASFRGIGTLTGDGSTTTADQTGRIVIGLVQERIASTMGTATEVNDIDIAERHIVLKFDFVDLLPDGEVVQTVTMEVDVREGVDATPLDLLDGDYELANSSTMVLQYVDGRRAPTDYSVRCIAVCSDSVTRVLAIHLPVRRL